MSEFFEHDDPSFDEQLRNVRIPYDLVMRLRQIAVADDADFDEALKDIALPAGLLARLRDVPVLSDIELDRQLGSVQVPTGFVEKLQQAVADEAADSELDDALCDVPVPQGLAWRVRHVSHATERRWRATRELAIAASLFLVVGLSYLGAVSGFVMTAFGVGSASPERALVVEPQRTQVTKPDIVPFELAREVSDDVLPAATPIAAAEYRPAPPVLPAPVVEQSPPIAALPIDWDLGRVQSDLLIDLAQAKWGKFLASPYVSEEFDPPPEVEGPRPGGIAAVFAKGYDTSVHAKYGVHPFVSPQQFARFRTSRPPLGSSTLSYEKALNDVFAGRRPNRDVVRVEEFLAAPDYAVLPAPRGQTRVDLFGGRSPFAGRAQHVQVVVTVGDAIERKRSPVHLIVAVDISASMSADGRLDRIRDAISEVFERLQPQDRLTLVAFNDEPNVLIERLKLRERGRLRAAMRMLQPSGATNLGAALQTCYSLAQATQPQESLERRIVVVGDGRAGLTPDAQLRVSSLLRAAADEKIAITLVDHSPRSRASASLSELATSGGSRAVAAATSQELAWAFSETLTNDSQVVLSGAKLNVQFNPKVVTRYRLIGHGSQI
ncbi:MAG: VWA domain-containing protein, partial [Pirellulales bacterium]|nr:VWA domain-containing protein [Pirellulales bacterium]